MSQSESEKEGTAQKAPKYRLTNDSSQPLGERSKHLSHEKIQGELLQSVREPNVQPVNEAIEALKETRATVGHFQENHPSNAKAALERALEKTKLLISNYPDAKQLPVSVDMNMMDIYADDVTLKRITNKIKDLIMDDRLQAARLMLREFASEIDIITVSLPIQTFHTTLQSSLNMIEQGQIRQAKALILDALRTLTISERPIPLPIIRTQALIDEVFRQVNENEVDQEVISQLLRDAEQQLTFAEELGYGTHEETFIKMRNCLEEIKRKLVEGQGSKELLSQIRSDLQSLREQISSQSYAA